MTARTYTLILEDLFCRRYRAEFAQGAKGQFPKLVKIERETIAFSRGEKIMVWSLYRESCHGKFSNSLKDAIRVAGQTIASAR